MKQLITIVTLLLSSVGFAQSGWEKVALTSSVSIQFPVKPIEAAGGPQKTFLLRQADSTANLVVAVTDLAAATGLDSATLAAEMQKPESWEQAKDAFLSTMGEEAVLVKNEMGVIKGVDALKLVINRKVNDATTNIITVLIFVKGTDSFNIIYNNRGGKADAKHQEHFFNSIDFQ